MKNKVSHIIIAFIVVCLTSFIIGCTSTKQLVPAASGQISADSARIVLQRETAFAGSGEPMFIMDSGKEIGSVASGGELIWDRKAGPMELTAFYHHVGNGNPVPLRICVGAGMSYKFITSPFDGKRPSITMILGTPVPCDQTAAANAGKNQQSQQVQVQSGGQNVILGRIEKYLMAPMGFKSGPPLWPSCMIILNDDNGVQSKYLVVGSGTFATIFYDADGTVLGDLSSGKARVREGRKVEIKYTDAPSTYVVRLLAVSVRYLD